MGFRSVLNAAAYGVSASVLAFGLSAGDASAQTTPDKVASLSCTMKFDAKRGVLPGDCYTREEVAKFVCLDNKPQLKSPACATPEAMRSAQLPLFIGTRVGSPANNLNVVTSNASKTKGYVLEREGNTYAVAYTYRTVNVNDKGAEAGIPRWAIPANNPDIASENNPKLAEALCKKSGYADGCMPHDATVKYFYDNKTPIVLGAKTQFVNSAGQLQDGKYMLIRLMQDGATAITLTDQYGAATGQMMLKPTTIITDNFAAVKGLDGQAVAGLTLRSP